MPAPTLYSIGRSDRVLGHQASWAATPARRPSRLDFLRPRFRAVEPLESRHVFSAPADPPVQPPVDDVPAVAPPLVVMDDPAWPSANIINTWHEANEENNVVVFKVNVTGSSKKGD